MRTLHLFHTFAVGFASLFWVSEPSKQPPPYPQPATMQRPVLSTAADAMPTAPTPPDFTLPTTINAKPGEAVALRPVTKGKYVVYHPLDGGLTIIPADMLSTKTGTVCWAVTPGRYRLLAYTALNNVPSLPVTVTIIVGDPPAPPPNPDPNPPGPSPTDPLQGAVNAAYSGDSPIDAGLKRNAAAVYVKYYRGVAALISTDRTATDSNTLLKMVQAYEDESGIDLNALVGVRAVLRPLIYQILPKGTTIQMNDANRKTLAAVYSRFASLLETAAK